jgi:hypothetical protein
VRDALFFERGRKSITLLEGSEATSARPSVRNNVKVKTFLVIKGGFRQTAEFWISDYLTIICKSK